MRTAFINELVIQARKNRNIFLIVGDLGYSVVEPFRDEFPDRFLNVGVAEQNMTGVAAGLASEGYHVFTYSIGNFPTLRCLEQIRNDICYHNLPVTVVSVGAGMAYGNLGYSHHCIQDIACLRGMPNLQILSPADPHETTACVDWLANNPGPSYLRIGKAGDPVLHNKAVNMTAPTAVHLTGSEVAIATTGSVLAEALKAVDVLNNHEFAVDVYSCTMLSPTNHNHFEVLNSYRSIISVEEHVREGGLGEFLCASLPRQIDIKVLALDKNNLSHMGTQNFLRHRLGLDYHRISEVTKQTIIAINASK
jgi:transketolase